MTTQTEQSCRQEGDIDRARYHFQILSDTAADLSGARQPLKILEAFLLSAQGGVGARGGFAAILEGRAFQFIAQSSLTRPLTSEYARVLRDHLDDLAEEGKRPFFVPSLQGALCPGQCEMLLVCPLDHGQAGVLGLERGLAERPYDENDRHLVAALGTLFQTSLRFSLFAARVELLNAELLKRNDVLDRQIYHLSALRDLSREIIRVDMTDVMENLLLTLLGHFSHSHGMIVLHDRQTAQTTISSKGLEQEISLSLPEVERLIYLCLTGAREKHLQALQVEPVEQSGLLNHVSLGFPPDRVFLFMLRDNLYGVIILGGRLGVGADGDEELLRAFVSQGVLHLKNADSFATITLLNTDLALQNEELRRTIAELTRARDRISMLEAAGKRIAGIIHQKAEDLVRVRWVDFVLILGLSIGMAFVFNLQSPRGIPLIEVRQSDVPFISRDEAIRLLSAENALLIDARPREFFDRDHAEGAINIPAQLFDLVYMMQVAQEDPERPIIIYGRTISRHYDHIVAEKFLGRDHERVFILDDPNPVTIPGGASS